MSTVQGPLIRVILTSYGALQKSVSKSSKASGIHSRPTDASLVKGNSQACIQWPSASKGYSFECL